LPSEEDIEAVRQVVIKHGEAWMNQDTQGHLNLWDPNHEPITLMPAEMYTPMKTYDELVDYYPLGPATFGAKAWNITDLTIDIISDDVAFALALVDVPYDLLMDKIPIPEEYLFPGCGPENALWLGRLTYVVHRTDDGWKIIHCEDSTCQSFRIHQLWTYHESLARQAMSAVRANVDEQTADEIEKILGPILSPPPQEYPVELMPSQTSA
jgi:hypothetical protein